MYLSTYSCSLYLSYLFFSFHGANKLILLFCDPVRQPQKKRILHSILFSLKEAIDTIQEYGTNIHWLAFLLQVSKALRIRSDLRSELPEAKCIVVPAKQHRYPD